MHMHCPLNHHDRHLQNMGANFLQVYVFAVMNYLKFFPANRVVGYVEMALSFHPSVDLGAVSI